MTTLFLSLFILFLLHTKPRPGIAKADPKGDFFRSCPPSTCGSLPIRFPLRIRGASSPSCGLPGLDVTCSDNTTALLSLLPSLPPVKVISIDYSFSSLTVQIGPGFGSLSSPCPLRNQTYYPFVNTTVFDLVTIDITLVNCSQKFVPGPDSGCIAGPIPCLSGSGDFVYAVNEDEGMGVIPAHCTVLKSGLWMPSIDPDPYDAYYYATNGSLFREAVDNFFKKSEIILTWYRRHREISHGCEWCERQGKPCGTLNWETNQTFCQDTTHGAGLRVKIITGTSTSGFLIIVTVSFILFYIFRQSEKERETRLKVERFLATYKSTKPTRYSYSGLKKITKRFRHKLGQGGFGSVYKGELPNGIPVAVKMLERSRREAEEFMNEVATMGRIHHVNVVRLLGFCSEGPRHALIYEFMPNESLEKFIFSKEDRRSEQKFSLEKLQDIATGVARGIEYLHQGCDQRILHFDIKPHNILLDINFNPKISDFGLAKLCSRDQSIVTMTAARGTMGYIAPEIYSRHFGSVSYKSDVYSFGMLLLEMVSGRRNVDPTIENRNEVYFPEWIYDQLVHGEGVGLATNNGEEEDIVRKLVIVSLWCIQWSPTDRPTMSRVVQMLTGHLESLQIPPKPFISSSDHDDDDTSVDVVVENATSSAAP